MPAPRIATPAILGMAEQGCDILRGARVTRRVNSVAMSITLLISQKASQLYMPGFVVKGAQD